MDKELNRSISKNVTDLLFKEIKCDVKLLKAYNVTFNSNIGAGLSETCISQVSGSVGNCYMALLNNIDAAIGTYASTLMLKCLNMALEYGLDKEQLEKEARTIFQVDLEYVEGKIKQLNKHLTSNEDLVLTDQDMYQKAFLDCVEVTKTSSEISAYLISCHSPLSARKDAGAILANIMSK